MRPDELSALLDPILAPRLRIVSTSHLSQLWAGYGHIYRIRVERTEAADHQDDTTYIVKTIRPPPTSFSEGVYDEGHARKMLSYRVEANFYREFASSLMSTEAGCFVPRLVGASSQAEPEAQTLILEDLAIRYPVFAERRATLSDKQVIKALQWLASFHARSWNIESSCALEPTRSFCPPPAEAIHTWKGKGLWRQGGYHYLATRIHELASIHPHHSKWATLGLHAQSDLPTSVDWCLHNPPDRTRLSLIHGDVKAANMAFSRDATKMAMYDFQYVGIGLGVQDLAKFLTTSISAHHLNSANGEERLLKIYHQYLIQQLPDGADYPFDVLCDDWQLALVDWVRFLAGWNGGFWGNVEWLQARVEALLSDEKWVERVRQRWRRRNQTQRVNRTDEA